MGGEVEPSVNVFEAPRADLEVGGDELGPSSDELALASAGFGTRASARVIDYVVMFAMSVVSGGLFGAVYGIVTQEAPELEQNVPQMVVGVLLGLVYHTVFEGLAGATPGKAILKLTVLHESGAPCTPLAAFVRSLGAYFDLLFFGLVGYYKMQQSSLNQRHGDVWAKTIVVDKRHLRRAGRGAGPAVLATVIALVVMAFVNALALL